MSSFTRILPVVFVAALLMGVASISARAQSPVEPKRFEKDGLAFDYGPNWELTDQSNPAAQQLVLLEKQLDAQIMIISLRGAISNPKQEEQAKTSLIEPSITRLLKQYEDAGIKVQRAPTAIDVNGVSAEGAQLRFAVDGQAGLTDVCWLMVNRRLVQLFFMRPEKSEAKIVGSWALVRNSLRIQLPAKAKH